MQEIVYLNGAFVPARDAKISIFDRGLLFADSVYEGFGLLEGDLIDLPFHYARLVRSLETVGIDVPLSIDEVYTVITELNRQNGIDSGFSYLQVTRGEQAPRDFVYAQGLTPNIFAFAMPQTDWFAEETPRAIRLKSQPDLRWARRDIKTTNLLAQVMAKRAAAQDGVDEALLIDDDGHVTECGSTSFYIMKSGVLITRPLSHDILHGCTRKRVLSVAEELGIPVEERLFTLREALKADEAFHTAASFYVKPVGEIDGMRIGNGKAGPATLKLRAAYLDTVRRDTYRP
ncbi:aminotransferase class IV [Roseovarius sp. 2305UL8-3]|uniref:aminotransferase class IV n=1 Tax=Roseovarius conchicola TaxID=3121636 RepID=UPI0035288F24